MELKLNIGYQELVELIKQLPINQLRKLKADINLIAPDKETDIGKETLLELLLKGPVMGDDQYREFLANRKYFSTWRTI